MKKLVIIGEPVIGGTLPLGVQLQRILSVAC